MGKVPTLHGNPCIAGFPSKGLKTTHIVAFIYVICANDLNISCYMTNNMNYCSLILCLIFLPEFYSKASIKPKPKLCIQCKHFIPDSGDGRFGKCSLFPRVEGK